MIKLHLICAGLGVALLLAACPDPNPGNPPVPDDLAQPCARSSECPEGLVCFDFVCREEPIDAGWPEDASPDAAVDDAALPDTQTTEDAARREDAAAQEDVPAQEDAAAPEDGATEDA